jgi:FdhD protein
MIFYEDLGRHNAIDMIQGKTLLEDIHTNDKLIVTTGRITSEILIKVIRIGVPMLASRSAATRLAIDLARKTNITLIGYVRGQRMTVYNHAQRIKGLP